MQDGTRPDRAGQEAPRGLETQSWPGLCRWEGFQPVSREINFLQRGMCSPAHAQGHPRETPGAEAEPVGRVHQLARARTGTQLLLPLKSTFKP